MRAVEGHRENHLLVNRVANVESIKMFVFVHVEFSPNDLLRTCQAPCSCLIPPLDTSAAGANVRDTYSLRENQCLTETWRAGRNKTPNTYVIEISLPFRAQGDRLKLSQKNRT